LGAIFDSHTTLVDTIINTWCMLVYKTCIWFLNINPYTMCQFPIIFRGVTNRVFFQFWGINHLTKFSPKKLHSICNYMQIHATKLSFATLFYHFDYNCLGFRVDQNWVQLFFLSQIGIFLLVINQKLPHGIWLNFGKKLKNKLLT
jgi:hypothetical protein